MTSATDTRSYRSRNAPAAEVVSKLSGHASAVGTLETYSPMWPDSEGRVVHVLDAAFDRHVACGPGSGLA